MDPFLPSVVALERPDPPSLSSSHPCRHVGGAGRRPSQI